MFFKIVLVFSGAVCVCAERSHTVCHKNGCFDSGSTDICGTMDGDEYYYVDFKNRDFVWESKIPSTFHVPYAYEYALYHQVTCINDVHRWQYQESTMKNDEPPEVVIYPRDEVIEEEDNTLICFINNFFPPKINIRWTKNDVQVAEEDPTVRFLPNPDGSFYFFSRLDFIPKDGDVYSCTVEHEALENPQTKFWEVEIDEASTGPAVFCGLGLTLGVLGVVGGAFFFVKGNQHQGALDADG